jgi:hypothetical protein
MMFVELLRRLPFIGYSGFRQGLRDLQDRLIAARTTKIKVSVAIQAALIFHPGAYWRFLN